MTDHDTKGDAMDTATTHWRITEAWEKALGHADFSDDDDFFAVGGDSMRATLVVRTLNKAGVPLDLAAFMAHPTVTGLAAAAGTERVELRRIPR
jgi:aryl carrier-like protein